MNFYLIQSRKNSVILYTEGERLTQGLQSESSPDFSNPLDRFLARLSKRKGRAARFSKNLIVAVRDLYYKLEHKIDPMERVFKRMRHAPKLNIFYSPRLEELEARERFEALLVRQKKKHLFWTGVDFVFALIMFIMSPFLIPIPGPNVFLYYPGLRMLSHYLARRGALHGLKLQEKSLQPLNEISDIELILNQQPRLDFERIHDLAGRLKLEHLPNFLERYS